MANSRKGALAAAASLDGSRLKVLFVGEGGALCDANGRLGNSSPEDSRLPNYLGLADGPRVLGSTWTDGGVVDIAHPQSAIAICTIERLNLICVFYQASDGSIVMRRCHMGAEWRWEGGKFYTKAVMTANYETPPVIGTSLVVQPNVLRVGDNSELKLFYQTQQGTMAIQRLKESGDLGSPAFETQLAIPVGIPFTALSEDGDFTISYITLSTQEIWECTGTLALAPWQEYDEDESYISVAQRFELQSACDVVQMAAFQAEHPIVIVMTGSPVSRVVWSSSLHRRKYLIEARGLPGTGIALVGHANLRSSVTYFFVDTNGAINVGRLASGSPNGTPVFQHYPIELPSMRRAFTWAISSGPDDSEVPQSFPQVTPTTAARPMVGPPGIPPSPSPRTVRSTPRASMDVSPILSPPISTTNHARSFSGRSFELPRPFGSQLPGAVQTALPHVSRPGVSSPSYQQGHHPRGSFALSTRPSSYYGGSDRISFDGATTPILEATDDSVAPTDPTSHTDYDGEVEKFPESNEPRDHGPLSEGSQSSEGVDTCCPVEACDDAEQSSQPEECDLPEDFTVSQERDPCPEFNQLPECDTAEPCRQPQECENSKECGEDEECSQLGESDQGEECGPPRDCGRPEACEQPEECGSPVECGRSQECGTIEGCGGPDESGVPEECDVPEESDTSDKGSQCEDNQSNECDRPQECDSAKECSQPKECEVSKEPSQVDVCDPLEGQDQESDQSQECGRDQECDQNQECERPQVCDNFSECDPPSDCDQDDEPGEDEECSPRDQCDKTRECEEVGRCQRPKECDTPTMHDQPQERGRHEECGERTESEQPQECYERQGHEETGNANDLNEEYDPSQGYELSQGCDRAQENHMAEEFEQLEKWDQPQECDPLRECDLPDQPDWPARAEEGHTTQECGVAETDQGKPGCVGGLAWVSNSTSGEAHESPKERPSLAHAATKSTPNQNFADELYERLEFLFKPSGNQYLSLQLPTRDLQHEKFYQRVSGAYSHLDEPAAMEEASFHLADELFDVGKFVIRPNGKSMSAVYEKILDSAVPVHEEDKEYTKRIQIREWLSMRVEERFVAANRPDMPNVSVVGDNVRSTSPRHESTHAAGPSDNSVNGFESRIHKEISGACTCPVHSMTRVELAQHLFGVYMQARSLWGVERDAMKREAAQTTDVVQRDKIARCLADVTCEREASLATLYADALVRGDLRTVRKYLGCLDFVSTSEMLLSARESLRAEARSSAQSSKLIYPIRMLPVDWLESSTTSYTEEVFYYDTRALEAQMIQKSTTLDRLSDQLFALRLPNEGQIERLEGQIENLTKAHNGLLAKLLPQYSMSGLATAKLSVGSVSPLDGCSSAPSTPASSFIPEISQSLLIRTTTDHSNTLSDELRSLQENREQLKNLGRALARETARAEIVKTREMQAMKSRLQRQVMVLHSELEHLEGLLAAAQVAVARRQMEAIRSISHVHLPPTDDSRWTTISFTTEVPNQTWNGVSSASGEVALWLSSEPRGSAPPGVVDARSAVQYVAVEVTFRVSTVAIDRSSWFRPHLLDKSNDLMRKPGHLPWSKWPAGINTFEEAVKSIKDGQFNADGSLMPAFTEAYVIAKDILVKVPTSALVNPTDTFRQHAATATGILSFGFKQTSQPSSNLSQLHMQEMSDGAVFRIPGPQILGYMMQLTPVDTSSPYDSSKGVAAGFSNIVSSNLSI